VKLRSDFLQTSSVSLLSLVC